MENHFQEGIELFNSGKYFAAHEAWEEIWLESQGEEKHFYQGLIQLAAAFHHFRRGNSEGAKSLATEALRKLQDFAPRHGGLDLKHLLEQMKPWQAFLGKLKGKGKGTDQSPPFPRLKKAEF